MSINSVIAIVGTNRTGKSSTAREIAIDYKRKTGQKIIAFDPQNRFDDIADKKIDLDNWKDNILKARNCLLILDDYKLLNNSNSLNKELKSLMVYRCYWDVDIIYITHSPMMIIPELTYFTSHYFIFKTSSGKRNSFKDRVPDYELCQLSSLIINEYVKLKGTSVYGEGVYPNKFRYISVDTNKGTLTGYNMEESLFLKIYERNKEKVK